MTDMDIKAIALAVREELEVSSVEPRARKAARPAIHRIWASMLRRTLPSLALVAVAGLLATSGHPQEASYVAVALAGGYAAASHRAATKKPNKP